MTSYLLEFAVQPGIQYILIEYASHQNKIRGPLGFLSYYSPDFNNGNSDDRTQPSILLFKLKKKKYSFF